MENCFTRCTHFQMVSLAVTVFAYFLFFSSTWRFWQEHFAMFKLTSTYSGISGVTWRSVAAFIHWHLFLKDCLIDTLTNDKQQDCNKAHKHIHHEADMVKPTALLFSSQRQGKLYGGINRQSVTLLFFLNSEFRSSVFTFLPPYTVSPPYKYNNSFSNVSRAL